MYFRWFKLRALQEYKARSRADRILTIKFSCSLVCVQHHRTEREILQLKQYNKMHKKTSSNVLYWRNSGTLQKEIEINTKQL